MIQLRQVSTEEEVSSVSRLAREIWVRHYDGIVGLDQIEYMLEKFQSAGAVARQIAEGYLYFLVEHEAEAVGYIGLVPEPAKGCMMLSKIYVREDRRGLGLGKAALDFAEDLCRKQGLYTLWLTVNKNNLRTIAWYERRGFTRAGPMVQDIGNGYIMDDFRMEKAPCGKPA